REDWLRMFSSRTRQHYQPIDGEYDEPDLRASGGQGLLPFYNRSYQTGPESAPLIQEASSVSFRPDVRIDMEEHNGPLLTASSSEDRTNWDHITDLDDFFRRIYDYYQGGGFRCIFWHEILSLVQFIFIVFVSTFFIQCVDYEILFNNKAVNIIGNSTDFPRKRQFGDAVDGNCASHLPPLVVACILVATIYWIFRVIRTGVLLLKLTEIQLFYNRALRIDDADLSNLTWESIVRAVCNAQGRIQLLVHDSSISSIHIYHRILRFKNYVVAMVNQDLLPPLISIPFVGDLRFLPEQLKKNLEWMFFLGFCSPFKGSYTLQDEYRDRNRLEEMAENMEKVTTYLGLASLIFSPLVFLYQCLYYLFTAADLTKRDAGALGNRSYTNYGRYRVRHFNELDHELKGRLNRSHAFASAYIAQFSSKLVVVFARKISFMAAAIFVILTGLSVWDEDVVQIEHMLTVITVCGMIALACRSIIPDENLVYQPEVLLNHVTSELHYVPEHWKGNAHDIRTAHEFESLFRLRAINLLEEIFSPFITPFVLLFYVRPGCRSILSFLLDNTERVEGLGDVCSFALLDVAKHGDPSWQKMDEDGGDERGGNHPNRPSRDVAHDGKTEMSCMQFAIRHPDWIPPPATANFIQNLRDKMERDAMAVGQGAGLVRNAFSESIHTILSMPLGGAGMNHLLGGGVSGYPMGGEERGIMSGMERTLEKSLRQSGHESIVDSLREQVGAEMRVSSLYLRGIRADKKKKVYSSMGPADASMFAVPLMETTMAPRSSTFQYPSEDEMERGEAMRRVEEEEEGEDDDDMPPRDFPI
ncbi:atg-9, partial [Pristionchus pacificus]|uniref:Autophagy-related protein 9 n=1 Tax=Pristionchus pacificus TaxID=54126 RepID=A0A8R1V5X4_PRIPA